MVSMKKSAVVLGLLAVVGGGVGLASAATSQNLNTPGAACNPFNASEADEIDYFVNGVRTIAAGPRKVLCPVARHPVSGPHQTFWVDGRNSSGASTLCVMYSHNFDGSLRSTYSFSSSAATYDQPVVLSSVGKYDYVSILCDMPANGNGVLFGVIAADN